MSNVLNRLVNTGYILRNVSCRFYSNKVKPRPKPKPQKVHANAKSLSDKGFMRAQKAYDPPSDVSDKLNSILARCGVSSDPHTVLDDPAVRFNILNDCFKEFNHSVPNSALYKMETVDDIQKHYESPVNMTIPLDAMKNVEDLPQNLHIQYEPHRFHPDTDTLFGGVTAFPQSSTIVTGLKYKEKYPGLKQPKSWPH